jgi:hypothetical protein
MIPIEPEPGNAGAGKRNLKESFGFAEALFLKYIFIPMTKVIGKLVVAYFV